METAYHQDFPWWYGQFPLPEETRGFYGFAHKNEEGNVRFFVPTSVPTGSRFVPLIAQIISKCLCTAAIREEQMQREILTDSCLDNNRFAGRTQAVERVSRCFERLTVNLGMTCNQPCGSTDRIYTFLGVLYNHINQTVAISEGIRNKVKGLVTTQTQDWTVRDC
ncbi:Hypothetical protein, putative, partial [Bodo saltans]